MYYADGSVYEGEWYDDKRNGRGLLRMGEIKGNDTHTPYLTIVQVWLLNHPSVSLLVPLQPNGASVMMCELRRASEDVWLYEL